MKKVFYVIAAAFITLYVASCTQEQEESDYEFAIDNDEVKESDVLAIDNDEVKDGDI